MIRRRSFFSSMLAAGAAVGAIPALSAIASTTSAAPAASKVFDLIDALAAATAKLDATPSGEHWMVVADDRSKVIEDLLGEQPASIIELHAKIRALMPIFEEDDEDQTLIFVVAQDVKALAQREWSGRL